MLNSDGSRTTFPILFKDPSFQETIKHQLPRGNILKRTMIEKNGESTPRMVVGLHVTGV